VVSASHVALGDWINGELVTERFPPDPRDPSRRVFRTGDMARFAPSGRIFVVGRKDRMVKIRGQRVEPALVEAAMLRMPGVAYASVQAQRDGAAARLLGFVVPKQGSVSLAKAVHQSLREVLPASMRPAKIIELEALPLAASGKIDRAALLRLADAETAQSAAAQPKTMQPKRRASADAERAVAIAWRRVLGAAPQDGVTFLDAGGDSLQLLELVFALESQTGRRLPLEAFNAEATAEAMVLALDSTLRPPAPSSVFMLPGALGDEPKLAALRAALPFVDIRTIQYSDWRKTILARRPIEDLIDEVLAQIREAAPKTSNDSPLCLIGYSIGAWVAFASACVLEREGRDVGLLVVIDKPAPARELRTAPKHAFEPGPMSVGRVLRGIIRLPQKDAKFLGSVAAWGAANLVPRAALRALARSPATQGWSRRLGHFGYWTRSRLAQELRHEASYKWMQRWHEPDTRLGAPVLLILTAVHPPEMGGDLGWSKLAERIAVVHVPGDHESMLSAEHRANVSDAVGVALRQAMSGQVSSGEGTDGLAGVKDGDGCAHPFQWPLPSQCS
jgi:thioesterase domain-containing protein